MSSFCDTTSPLVESGVDAFTKRYGRPPTHVAVAPGRVNVIGEHVDYNGGFVLPAAIEREVVLVARPRSDRRVRIASGGLGEVAEFSVDEIRPSEVHSWDVYVKGVLAVLGEKGFRVCGFDGQIVSSLPVGGGLSSSAALESATALAILAMTGEEADRPSLAKICQEAEHRFAGVPCGIMDQSAVLRCEADHLLMLDCRTETVVQTPFVNPDWALMIIHSGVSHSLATGEYGKRRTACEEAAAVLEVETLRDIPVEDLEKALKHPRLNEEARRCVRHVVTEIDRTQRAVDALERADYETLGRLLHESHASLRDDFRVSCAELDFIVETTQALEGVAGCRMTGGGFGGAAVALVRTNSAAQVREKIQAAYAEEFGFEPWVFLTRAASGARAWKLCASEIMT